jgi:hypothetical protein
MKKIGGIVFVSLVLLLASCRSPSNQTDLPRDPLHDKFATFTGEQQAWPAAVGAFAKTCEGVPIYYGLPNKPYTVIGHVAGTDINEKQLARCAKAHAADAVYVLSQGSVNLGTKIDNGVTLFGNGWAYTTPATAKPDIHILTSAYIIKFKETTPSDPVRAKLDDLRSAIEWADANPYGATVGEAFITADQILAGEKQLLKNLNFWIEWCDQHPSGGTFSDADGKTINVPAEMISPVRAELQKHRDHLQSKFGEGATP